MIAVILNDRSTHQIDVAKCALISGKRGREGAAKSHSAFRCVFTKDHDLCKTVEYATPPVASSTLKLLQAFASINYPSSDIITPISYCAEFQDAIPPEFLDVRICQAERAGAYAAPRLHKPVDYRPVHSARRIITQARSRV
ncbi:hypothetical protein Bbelb_104320 [Branchiostoma belcheri]|nr:hypothetical protein Bbelb_104320 [Branchiostoma belcheri]